MTPGLALLALAAGVLAFNAAMYLLMRFGAGREIE